jgi:hypothetical protein
MPALFKTVLPALAMAGSAYAACSTSGTATIQNQGDATALASCSTFSGNIAVATSTTEDISLDGIKMLKGNLVVKDNDKMKRLSASQLETLDGEMELNGATQLFNVDFPKLKTVDSIKWNALPNLQDIGFTSEVEKADKIDIQNTALRSLKGINIEKVDTIFIANNGFINDISMQLGNVSDSLTFADNNEDVKVSLPNLIWATNMTFRFCGSVSVPSLESLNGSLGLYNNGFETFSAPNLTSIGQALALVANEKLSNLTFPMLQKINGNLQIANNTKLDKIEGFPALERIGASFDMSGNMSTIETEKLNFVKGAFNLQSTSNVSEACDYYQGLKDKKIINGKFFCRGKVEDPGEEGHKPTDQGGKKASSATTLSAVNGAFGLAAMAAVFLL